MIKVRGMSVFPSELEVLLGRHAAVLGSAVVARPDRDKGQVPVAFIRLRPGHDDVSAEALTAWCREHMATYKVPEIRVVDELPMTATGKVKKGNCRNSSSRTNKRWADSPPPRPDTTKRILETTMNTQRRHLLKLSAAMLGGLALHRPALAQTVTGPIRIVLPYPPGGSTDAITRFIADKLGTALKTNVIVDNRPGAAGMIGAAAVATAPDGRTLLFTNTALIQSPLIQPQPLYNPLTDFEALTLVADAAQVLVASDATPARTLPEYVEWARKHPGSAYGSLGSAPLAICTVNCSSARPASISSTPPTRAIRRPSAICWPTSCR
jgi:hypothetical protein